MDYYKIKARVRDDILHWLKNNQDITPWQQKKKEIMHKYLVGNLTIERILLIYNLRENKKGGLENVNITDGPVRDAQEQERTETTANTQV